MICIFLVKNGVDRVSLCKASGFPTSCAGEQGDQCQKMVLKRFEQYKRSLSNWIKTLKDANGERNEARAAFVSLYESMKELRGVKYPPEIDQLYEDWKPKPKEDDNV